MFSYQEALFAFRDARDEYNAAFKLMNDDIQQRVDNHNQVVRNLARKFGGSMSFQEIYDECKISVDLKDLNFITEQSVTFTKFVKGTWPQRDTTTNNGVPARLLLNDPIASAVYTRKKIRALQAMKQEQERFRLKKELASLKSQKTKFEKQQAALQKEFDQLLAKIEDKEKRSVKV